MRKWCFIVCVTGVTMVLPFSIANSSAEDVQGKVVVGSKDGNRTKIIKRSKYLDTIKDSLMSEKLKEMPVAPDLYKGFRGMRDPTRPTKGTVLKSVEESQARITGGEGRGG
ncbi:MAG: hypothetical protein KAS48_04605, partial [Gammaproteobacteria bacterium]|nr:hypothetical protein [Gammaproteobacteria bacterium]